MLKDRLSKGLLPEPKNRKWGKRAWTADEVRQAIDRFQGGPARLPKKSFYTSADVAQALCLTREQFRYAIEQGRVADCERRDEQGRRVWTAEEVERALARLGGGEDVRHDPGGNE
jgi:hypothetical protein